MSEEDTTLGGDISKQYAKSAIQSLSADKEMAAIIFKYICTSGVAALAQKIEEGQLEDTGGTDTATEEVLKVAVRDGSNTSEYKIISWVNRILTILTILFPIIDAAITFLQDNLGEHVFGDSLWVSSLLMFFKVYLADRYSRMREKIKIAVVNNPSHFYLEEK